ncbi:hypothetical protein SAMN05216570_2384 [Dyella sp. OK004]|uniref:DUF5362 domain-containing protein n=1 Tax=Dyella sp. OK004 TaxID=1855292 RepID=UPI0008DF50DF|nr:DUF5362 domain-containing protein [Dyella sp. OK004]SFS08303.1 hypothetical protein SAMN05216570_2384 [Dyella sp. OK004]
MSDQFASLGQASSSHSVSELSQPLASGSGWMKFVGIMFIIQGALTAITIVGIIIAWLPIWIGVLVMQSAGAIERAQASGDANALKEALAKLKTYFVIQGVLYLVGIVLMVLYVIFFGAMFAAMMKSGGFPH